MGVGESDHLPNRGPHRRPGNVSGVHPPRLGGPGEAQEDRPARPSRRAPLKTNRALRQTRAKRSSMPEVLSGAAAELAREQACTRRPRRCGRAAPRCARAPKRPGQGVGRAATAGSRGDVRGPTARGNLSNGDPRLLATRERRSREPIAYRDHQGRCRSNSRRYRHTE
jgi:hypothetical protein